MRPPAFYKKVWFSYEDVKGKKLFYGRDSFPKFSLVT